MELIGRKALLLNGPKMRDWGGDMTHLIINAPTVDAVPVVMGTWIKSPSGGYKCRCGFWHDSDEYNYCPNCGAKMEGEE